MVAMLDNQDLTTPFETIVVKETEKAVEIESKGKDWRRKFVETASSTGARLPSSWDESPADIFVKPTDKEAYFKVLGNRALKLSL